MQNACTFMMLVAVVGATLGSPASAETPADLETALREIDRLEAENQALRQMRNTVVSAPTHDPEPEVGVGLIYLRDTRNYDTLGVSVSVKNLPGGFDVWGFTDLHGVQNDREQRSDAKRSFTELRLTYTDLAPKLELPGLGLQLEYNDLTPGKNALVRIGPVYRHSLPIPALGPVGGGDGWLQWRVFPLETDRDGGQLSLIYSIPLLEGVRIGGFADFNFGSRDTHRWVIEPALSVHLWEGLWGVIEYRYNGYESAAGLEGTGWAFGIRGAF